MNSSTSSSSVNSTGGGGSGDSGDSGETTSGGPGSSEVEINCHNYETSILRKQASVVHSACSSNHYGISADEHIYKMAPEAVDPAILSRGCLSLRRYTRSALLSIRDDALSKCRPDCVGDPRLTNLGFWRQDSSRQNFRSSSGSGVSNSNSSNLPNNPKAVIDHRSISSSHLMPAFMKRQAITIPKPNSVNNNMSSGNNGAGTLQSSETSKESMQQRHRKDTQHQQNQHQEIILSPQRKSMNMGCQMPTSAPSNQHSDRDLPTTIRERRIGSGRLPPRDVNWDYRPEKENLPATTNADSDSYSNPPASRSSGPAVPYRSVLSGNPNQEYREHRYERRSFGRNSAGGSNVPEYIERHDSRDSSNNNYVRRFISDLANNSSGNGPVHSFSSNDRRSKQYSDSRAAEEPEWLNAGPISQHDTIELRGFEDADDIANCHHEKEDTMAHSYKQYKGSSGTNGNKRLTPAQDQVSTRFKKAMADADDSHSTTTQQSPPPARSTPTKGGFHDSNNNMKSNNSGPAADCTESQDAATGAGGVPLDERKQNTEDRDSKHVNLNFDEILKLESLNDILVGDNNNRKAGSSRFSQWFKHSSPTNQTNAGVQIDSRRSSLHEELNIDSNQSSFPPMTGGITLQQQHRAHSSQHPVQPDSNREKYFVPISPATGNVRQQQPNHALLEFLLKNNLIGQNNQMMGTNNLSQSNLQNQNPCPAGSITSVEELEARMRKNENLSDGSNSNTLTAHNQNQFSKLLSGNSIPCVSHNQAIPQQQQQQQQAQQHQSQSNPHISHNSPPPPQQQDMETFRKLISALRTQQQQHQHQQMIFQQMLLNRTQQHQQQQQQQQQQNQQRSLQQQIQLQQQQLLQKFIQMNGQISRSDLMKIPEAQNIIQGIVRGDITQNSLLQQLASSSISIRDREIIVSVLNYFNQHQQHSNSSPVHPIISSSAAIQQHLQIQQHLNKNCSVNGVLSAASNSSNGNGSDTCASGSNSNNTSSGNCPPVVCSIPPVPSTVVHQPAATSGPAPNDLIQSHLLFQQQAQKQLRLSPLPNVPQRIPSPRELQFHTQSIMQNALIKKKLEEQQENYRRRQEIEKQQQQQHGVAGVNANVISGSAGNTNDSIDSSIQQSFNHSPPPIQQQSQQHNKQINSPTPLAFTPTSVLRKMTAEKENFINTPSTNATSNDASKNLNPANAMQSLLLSNVVAAINAHQQHQPQPRMILGGGSTVQQPQQNQQPGQQSYSGPGGPSGSTGPPISPQTAALHHAIRNNQNKWNQLNVNQIQQQIPKPMGRPILKGRSVTVPDPISSQVVMIPPAPQLSYGSKIEFHQQQQQQATQQQLQQQHLQLLQQRRARAHQFQQIQYRQQVLQKGGPNSGVSNPSGPGNKGLNPDSPSAPNVSANQGHLGIPPVSSSGVIGGIMNVNNTTPTNSVGSVSNNANTGAGIGINYQRDGGLSPTSNQLARWFSPELLAKASAGKLPSLNMGQALSLEEFERSIQHSSAAVHN